MESSHGLFCDIARALHKTSAIESVDLANCYDAMAHSIASIALQSFKVKKVMVAMVLYVLKTMQWFLKTAFGQSKTSFGGTKWDPLMGLGQGNTAAPPWLPGSEQPDDECLQQIRSWDRICGRMVKRCIYVGSSSVRG
jgi:hypothetical protein